MGVEERGEQLKAAADDGNATEEGEKRGGDGDGRDAGRDILGHSIAADRASKQRD
jgi:hypothetical protein